MDGTPARRAKPRPLLGAFDDWARRKTVSSYSTPPKTIDPAKGADGPAKWRGRTTPSTRSSGSDCSSESGDRECAKLAKCAKPPAPCSPPKRPRRPLAKQANALAVPSQTALATTSPARKPCEAISIADAVRQRNVVEFSWLMNAGADINEPDTHGETPLFRAAASGDLVMVFLLLEGRADPRCRSPAGLTALDLARDQQCANLIGAMMPGVSEASSREALHRALEGLPPELRRRCCDLAQVADEERQEGGLPIEDLMAPKALPTRDGTGRGILEGASDFNDYRAYRAPTTGASWTAQLSRQAYHLGPAAYYCDGGSELEDYIAMEDYIPMDMDDVMEDLLFRDITPEDYELLLQLDEGLARNTAGEAEVNELESADPEAAIGETCAVCLLPFEDEEPEGSIAVLPCRHFFHRECISKWLLERSRSCPLCGEAACPEH